MEGGGGEQSADAIGWPSEAPADPKGASLSSTRVKSLYNPVADFEHDSAQIDLSERVLEKSRVNGARSVKASTFQTGKALGIGHSLSWPRETRSAGLLLALLVSTTLFSKPLQNPAN